MTMRLIDADALKEKFENLASDDYNEPIWYQNTVFETIDNAPTVESDMEFAEWVTKMIFGNNDIENFDFELFSELACRKLEKLGLVEKAKSEWIEMKDDDLCKTCKHGDVCELSTKMFSGCRTSKCYKHEEVDNDKTN